MIIKESNLWRDLFEKNNILYHPAGPSNTILVRLRCRTRFSIAERFLLCHFWWFWLHWMESISRTARERPENRECGVWLHRFLRKRRYTEILRLLLRRSNVLCRRNQTGTLYPSVGGEPFNSSGSGQDRNRIRRHHFHQRLQEIRRARYWSSKKRGYITHYSLSKWVK